MSTVEAIGPYLLGKCLGKGGFGAVHEATHQETGQRVAIKVLHDTRQLEPEVQNRFVREVSLLKRLDHKNIVRVFDSGLHEGSIYCAMELVECGNLKEILLKRDSLPWREAAEVALQVCHALDHAHQQGCIHRDLKPANLYLAEDGLVKLGDLGLARDLNNSRLTAEGQTVGTWRYMPPEQITGQAEIDGRLDIYALGCILFEMIAGRVPFDGPDFATVFDQHLEVAPPRLDVVTDNCPRALADLVEWMLEKHPDSRPENAAVVAENLEGILAGELSHIDHQPDPEHSSVAITISREAVPPNLTQRLHSLPEKQAVAPRWDLLLYLGAAIVLVIAIVLAVNSGE